jgi:hypothetical protein
LLFKDVPQLNETQTLNMVDGVGKIIPIKYFTYFIPFEYIFKQYPSEIITASFTDPFSATLTVSLKVNTSYGIILLKLTLHF